MPSPLYSGAAAIMLGTMTSRPDLGWSYFEKLKAADAVAVRGNGAVVTAVANGEKAYGVLVDFMAFNAKAKGSPIDFIFPAEGLPAVTEPVAILKTTQNAAAARAFVDFILSDEGQKLAVAMGYIPAKVRRRDAGVVPGGSQDPPDADRHRQGRADEQRQSEALLRSLRQLAPDRSLRNPRALRLNFMANAVGRARPVRGLRAAVGPDRRRRASCRCCRRRASCSKA